VAVEEGIAPKVIAQLQEMGHNVVVLRGMCTQTKSFIFFLHMMSLFFFGQGDERATFGRGQIIWRDPITSVMWAGSDPRADGMAIPRV
jgi:gamma-glutamyltranspeptidase